MSARRPGSCRRPCSSGRGSPRPSRRARIGRWRRSTRRPATNLADPRKQVGRVRAGERDHRLGGVQALRSRCGTARSAARVGSRLRPQRLGDVVVRPGPVDGQARGCGSPARPRSETWRRLRRNGVRCLVAGFASLTSGVRSSSVARRLTKVVFAWRRVGGNATSARSSDASSRSRSPPAPGWRSGSGPRGRFARSATAPSAFEPVTMNCVKVRWSRVISSRSWRPVERRGLEVLVAAPGALRVAGVQLRLSP